VHTAQACREPLSKAGKNISKKTGAACVLFGILAGMTGAAATVTIPTVPVGNAGNTGELSGSGSGGYGPDAVVGGVPYKFNIGKYEVTAGQYTTFLNAVAASDTYALYNTSMWSSAHGCKVERSGSPGSYTYSVALDRADRPVNFVSWGDAARFSNWLHNGQPTGAQNDGTTENGSYLLNGAMTDAALLAVIRKANATWVLPSEDEWYKSAYHKNDGVTGNYWAYPTGSEMLPGRDMVDLFGNNANIYGNPYPIESGQYTTIAGQFQNSDSPYGTFDQGGNLWEWNEAVIYGARRGLRGGSFSNHGVVLLASNRDMRSHPASEDYNVGFRVCLLAIPGDFNQDGRVDSHDFEIFQACASGPGVAYDPDDLPAGCTLEPDQQGFIAADFDQNFDVDQTDFGIFQRCYSDKDGMPQPRRPVTLNDAGASGPAWLLW
jgi:formylglycine-generating enzyme